MSERRNRGISIHLTRAGLAAGAALLSGAALVGAVVARRRFDSHLERLSAVLRGARTTPQNRSDLPAEVRALAERLGVPTDSAASFAEFTQTGQMWAKPGGAPINFRAHQTVRVDSPGFVWRAVTQLPSPMVIADYFTGGVGGLEVRIAGAVPIAHTVANVGINRGELLRYLAEIPLNPDAILANHALEWSVIDARTIMVASGAGAGRGEITFELGEDGLIATASAATRDYASKDGPVPLPWHGRFWNYRRSGGRLIPEDAEVAYTLDTGDFIYWRGRSFDWHQPAVPKPGA